MTLVGTEPAPVSGGRKSSSSISLGTGPWACDPGLANQMQLWTREGRVRILPGQRGTVRWLWQPSAAAGGPATPWRGATCPSAHGSPRPPSFLPHRVFHGVLFQIGSQTGARYFHSEVLSSALFLLLDF